MVPEVARRAVERTQGRATVLVADAAQLPLADSGFDLVCYSFNGLDYADPPTRTRILREAARVLRPGGSLYFTTHSLEWLLDRSGPECRAELSDIERQRPARLRADRSAGMVVLHDDVGNGTCYVTHKWELEELRVLGFIVTDVHDDNSSSRAYLAERPGLP